MKIYQVDVGEIEDRFSDAYFDYSDNEDQDVVVVNVNNFADDNIGQQILDDAKSLGAKYVLAGNVPNDGVMVDVKNMSCKTTEASWDNGTLYDVVNVREIDGSLLIWTNGNIGIGEDEVMGEKVLDTLQKDGFVLVDTYTTAEGRKMNEYRMYSE